MTTVIPVNKEQMFLMSTLDKGVRFMRSKGDAQFNAAIEKHKNLKKEVLQEVVSQKKSLS